MVLIGNTKPHLHAIAKRDGATYKALGGGWQSDFAHQMKPSEEGELGDD